MTELKLLEEINTNIRKLLGVTATQSLSDEKKILVLQSMGFSSPEISSMTGIPEPTVRKKWKGKTKKQDNGKQSK